MAILLQVVLLCVNKITMFYKKNTKQTNKNKDLKQVQKKKKKYLLASIFPDLIVNALEKEQNYGW